MTNKAPINHYADFEPISEIYKKAVTNKQPCHTLRSTHMKNDLSEKYTTIETVLVPCSQNGVDIDYTVAYADFRPSQPRLESQLYLIAP